MAVATEARETAQRLRARRTWYAALFAICSRP
jgi:hypothetical protein